MAEPDDPSDERMTADQVEDPLEISDQRYARIVDAAVEVVPSLASWIWTHRSEIENGEFGRILALLERLPSGDRVEVLELIREERISALHDLLVRIDVELYAPLEQQNRRFFGTLHNDFVGTVDDADGRSDPATADENVLGDVPSHRIES